MFTMIRAGYNYATVIVVTPSDAMFETEGATFYQRNTWQAGENPVCQFYEISRAAALNAFSGHADAWGHAERPKEVFESLEQVELWIAGKRQECAVSALDEIEAMHYRDARLMGLRHPLMKTAVIKKADLGKIFLVASNGLDVSILSREEFLKVHLLSIGCWAHIGEFDVTDWS